MAGAGQFLVGSCSPASLVAGDYVALSGAVVEGGRLERGALAERCGWSAHGGSRSCDRQRGAHVTL